MKRYNQAFLILLTSFVFLTAMTLWCQKIALTMGDPFANIGYFTLLNLYVSWVTPLMVIVLKVALVFYWSLMVLMVLKRESLIRFVVSNEP